jgi:hypothetical protein
MINNDELEKYSATYSEERLSSFAYSDIDTIKNIVENYGNNMIISQSLYP